MPRKISLNNYITKLELILFCEIGKRKKCYLCDVFCILLNYDLKKE